MWEQLKNAISESERDHKLQFEACWAYFSMCDMTWTNTWVMLINFGRLQNLFSVGWKDGAVSCTYIEKVSNFHFYTILWPTCFALKFSFPSFSVAHLRSSLLLTNSQIHAVCRIIYDSYNMPFFQNIVANPGHYSTYTNSCLGRWIKNVLKLRINFLPHRCNRWKFNTVQPIFSSKGNYYHNPMNTNDSLP